MADVEDEQLRALVADQLGRPVADVELLSSVADSVAYDLDSITTAGRCWVRGEARVDGARVPFVFFVKVMQSWARSPLFAVVPPELRAMAEASVPWRTEALVYRSDLRDRLPVGLTMPVAHGVFDLDDRSASVWLEAVKPSPAQGAWDLDRFSSAAYLLGRLAASPAVAERAGVGGHGWTVHHYLYGRLESQVLPLLRDDTTWRHPLVAASFDDALRQRLLDAADRAAPYVDELAAMPTATGHGDACPNNLLARPAGERGFVLIDYAFWGPMPIGFDLGQLLVGEVQLGRLPTTELATIDDVIVAAYVAGLRAEGNTVTETVVRRAHALQLLIFTGLSALPFEHLDQEPTDELFALGAERAALARFSLDLVDSTGS
jgi:hypothetical protein